LNDTLNETIRGSGHIGSSPWFGYHMGWPLASLSVAPDSLTFSMWPVTYRFERSSIRYLLKKRLLGRTSLFIVHTNAELPKSVVFRPLQFSRLEFLLIENVYQLDTEEADLSGVEPIQYSNVIPAIGYIATIAGLIAAAVAVGISAGIIGRK
jgi:hypothetical protein